MVPLFFLPPAPTDVRSSSLSVTDPGPNATRTWVAPEVFADSASLELG